MNTVASIVSPERSSLFRLTTSDGGAFENGAASVSGNRSLCSASTPANLLNLVDSMHAIQFNFSQDQSIRPTWIAPDLWKLDGTVQFLRFAGHFFYFYIVCQVVRPERYPKNCSNNCYCQQ